MARSAGATIEGINELLADLAPNRIKQKTAIQSGKIINELHAALRKHVKNKYAAQNDLDKRRIKTSISSAGSGRKVLKHGLQYKNKYSDLSKFPTTWRWGNINAGARRKGRVHSTTVVRGRTRIVYGRGRGGFMPRDKQGTPRHFGKYGTQMFERKGRARNNLILLLAPTTDMMVNSALRSPEVQTLLDSLEVKLTNAIGI